MSWLTFLKERRVFLVCQLLIVLFFTFVLSFFHVALSIRVLICLAVLMLTIASLAAEYLPRKRFYDALCQSLEQLDQKYLLSEILEYPDFQEGKICCDLLQGTGKAMNDAIAEYRIAGEDYRQYVEAWIHEIKTPISVAEMLCKNHPGSISREMRAQLHRIEEYVEQALYYARSTNLEKDYQIRAISLRNLVASAVKRHASQLISLGCTPVLESLDGTVYTDEKWMEFILGQLIANSIQYRSDVLYLRFSSIEMEEGTLLTIEDRGIGIPSQDLSRVFDKGFTGENGRKQGKSTGIGLYLCRVLCEKMNLRLTVESAVGKGTCFHIFFPKNKLILLE